MVRATVRLALVGGVLVVATAAFSGGSDDSGASAGPPAPSGASSSAASSMVPLLQPDAPGEPNTTVDPDDVEVEDAWGPADVAYAQMMIPHHAQALEMVALAERRATDPRLAKVAGRIRDTQRGEVAQMASWLLSRDQAVPAVGLRILRAVQGPAGSEDVEGTEGTGGTEGTEGMAGMHAMADHHDMPGMLTPAQLDELAATGGAAFDRLFVERMVAHHRGALQMADDVLGEGTDVLIRGLAADVALAQRVEIGALQEVDVARR